MDKWLVKSQKDFIERYWLSQKGRPLPSGMKYYTDNFITLTGSGEISGPSFSLGHDKISFTSSNRSKEITQIFSKDVFKDFLSLNSQEFLNKHSKLKRIKKQFKNLTVLKEASPEIFSFLGISLQPPMFEITPLDQKNSTYVSWDDYKEHEHQLHLAAKTNLDTFKQKRNDSFYMNTLKNSIKPGTNWNPEDSSISFKSQDGSWIKYFLVNLPPEQTNPDGSFKNFFSWEEIPTLEFSHSIDSNGAWAIREPSPTPETVKYTLHNGEVSIYHAVTSDDSPHDPGVLLNHFTNRNHSVSDVWYHTRNAFSVVFQEQQRKDFLMLDILNTDNSKVSIKQNSLNVSITLPIIDSSDVISFNIDKEQLNIKEDLSFDQIILISQKFVELGPNSSEFDNFTTSISSLSPTEVSKELLNLTKPKIPITNNINLTPM